MSNDEVLDSTVQLEPSYLHQKAEAKALFLAGYQVKKISDVLGIPNPETISGWATRENWHIARDLILESTTKNRLAEVMAAQDANIKDIKSIRDKAIEAINSGQVTPTKFSEAANAYLSAIDMERKIKMESLQISFIYDISVILKEEITDSEILSRVAEKLRKMLEKYQISID